MARIDLRGPQGNAHYVLGVTEQYLRAMGRPPAAIAAVMDEAMRGPYEHLLDVCAREAGLTYTGRKRATK